MAQDELLFWTEDLRDMLDARVAAVRAEVESLDADRLLNTAPDDLAVYLVKTYSVLVPSLRLDLATQSHSESRIDASRDPGRDVRDRSRPFYIAAQHLEVEVPFDGERGLMSARASTFTSSPPRA